MTRARSLLTAMAAVALLIGARPIAGVEQFPHGLLASADPKAVGSCTIETRPLSFGMYDPLAGTDVDAIGQVIYTCEKGNGNGGGPGTTGPDKNSIRIEMAQGTSNSFAPRHMLGPGLADLEYNIYLDATHRQVWGTGEGPTLAYIDTNPPNRTPVIVPAFGRIFGRQEVEAGPYADNVPVRILF
jgi:spore coat protein U-like protein